MTFSSIVGHENVKAQLLQQVATKRIPHAQLLAGPPGSPGLPLALAWITHLQCPALEACGTCPSCRHMSQLTHPDVHFLFPIGTSTVAKEATTCASFLPHWREFVTKTPYGNLSAWNTQLEDSVKQFNMSKGAALALMHTLQLKPFMGPYKIALIWLPEYLHGAAANALLKVLEEPQPNTLFILVSHAPQQLLATTVSRLQPIYLRPFSDEELTSALASCEADVAVRAEAVLLANGDLYQAQQFLEGSSETHLLEWWQIWLRHGYQGNFVELTAQHEALHLKGALTCKRYLTYGLHLLRATLLLKHGQTQLARITPATQKLAAGLGKTLTAEELLGLIAKFERACRHMSQHASIKMLLMDLAIGVTEAFSKSVAVQVTG